MEGQNYLGIYLSKNTATVVCLGTQGRDRNVLGCFSVSVEEQEEAKPHLLASLIAQGCAERGLKFSEVAVALDCAVFMQHNVHSEFSDPKQIAATVRFDTEEALAVDIADIAIAFGITSSDQTGSELTVFTAQRKILSEVLLSLQSNNIDPVTMEPDVNSLSRFISRNISLPEDSHPFFGILSRRNSYFIVPAGDKPTSQETSALRTFLIGPKQNRGELLAREIPVTAALTGTDEPINYLKIFDSTDSVDYQQLSEKLGTEAGFLDLIESGGASTEVMADCADSVDFAIAYGAALAHWEKSQSMNFRNDFSPFQGKKLRRQKTLKFLSISVTVLVLALGLYFQLQLLQQNKYRSRLRLKFAKQYSAITLGEKLPAKNPDKKLAGTLRRVRDYKSGLSSATGEESISAKLTLVLGAFNKCAARTGLQIDSISITTKNISIVGDTSSRKNTLKLFEAIKEGNLNILQQKLDPKGGRDNFRISIMPNKRNK